jgi:hypothetical protein
MGQDTHNILYVVSYWLPFPSSEYGGIEGWVAKDDEQVIRMICDQVDEYYQQDYPDFKAMITGVVQNATCYVVANSVPLGKQFSFTT